MKLNIPFDRINWITSSFLISTAIVSVTAVPLYLWHYGLDWFQVVLFLFYFAATGLSITLGYHRLFAHLSFKASWPVKMFTLVFGAAAFQESVIEWVSDHRNHHKHVDHDHDPYDISKGFFHAHIGWLLFRYHPVQQLDNVGDLQNDPLVMWQHRWWVPLGFFVGYILPAILGYLYGGSQAALGAFLIAGVGREFFVQHMTFLINSFCHCFGKRPYSSKCSARDSSFIAFFTFGEGYHNFHHEFQHDYRNGVKFWHFDPTKWTIWLLNKCGFVKNLRRASREKILLAELDEMRNLVDKRLETCKIHLTDSTRQILQHSVDYLQDISLKLSHRYKEVQNAVEQKIELSRETLSEWRREINEAKTYLKFLHQPEFNLQAST